MSSCLAAAREERFAGIHAGWSAGQPDAACRVATASSRSRRIARCRVAEDERTTECRKISVRDTEPRFAARCARSSQRGEQAEPPSADAADESSAPRARRGCAGSRSTRRTLLPIDDRFPIDTMLRRVTRSRPEQTPPARATPAPMPPSSANDVEAERLAVARRRANPHVKDQGEASLPRGHHSGAALSR